MGFTASETIHRSQQEVWEYLSDWKRAPDWMPGIDSMRQEHSGLRAWEPGSSSGPEGPTESRRSSSGRRRTD